MGCDIHIIIQRQELDGVWHELPYQTVWRSLGHQPVEGFPEAPEVFRNRNYDLFGILANVRNGRGFAGIKTGEGWPSIAPERGLPEGFDPETTLPNPAYPTEGGRWVGDHSFTWVTLEELKDFDWDEVMTWIYGVVPAEKYEELVAVGETPNEYCGDIAGPGIQVYEPDEYRATKKRAEKPYVRMGWPVTAREATWDWPGDVIPWLEKMADGRPLRLVVGFDS